MNGDTGISDLLCMQKQMEEQQKQLIEMQRTMIQNAAFSRKSIQSTSTESKRGEKLCEFPNLPYGNRLNTTMDTKKAAEILSLDKTSVLTVQQVQQAAEGARRKYRNMEREWYETQPDIDLRPSEYIDGFWTKAKDAYIEKQVHMGKSFYQISSDLNVHPYLRVYRRYFDVIKPKLDREAQYMTQMWHFEQFELYKKARLDEVEDAEFFLIHNSSV